MSAQFTPTSEMIKIAETVFMAMAWTQTVRPVVNKHKQAVLDSGNFMYEDRYQHVKDKSTLCTGKITNIEHDWLMSDADFLIYHNQVQELNDRDGLKVDDPECCPLLIAENNERKIKRELALIMQPITKINPDTMPVDMQDTLLELTLNLLAPYCRQSAELMNDLKTVRP